MKLSNFLELLLLSALWGGSFLFLRVATPIFEPITLIGLRSLVATLFLLPFWLSHAHHNKVFQHWRAMAFLGLLSTALPFSLMAYATLFVSAGFTAILNAMTPLFTALVAYIWFRQKLSGYNLLGIFIGLSGVVILATDKVSLGSTPFIKPLLAMMVGTFCYALTACFSKRFLSKVTPINTAIGSQFFSSLFLLPWMSWEHVFTTHTLPAWISVFGLGVGCTGIALLIYFKLIHEIGVSKTVSVTYLIPLFGMLWGAIFLAERITLPMLAGCGVILLGVALVTDVVQPKPSKAE